MIFWFYAGIHILLIVDFNPFIPYILEIFDLDILNLISISFLNHQHRKQFQFSSISAVMFSYYCWCTIAKLGLVYCIEYQKLASCVCRLELKVPILLLKSISLFKMLSVTKIRVIDSINGYYILKQIQMRFHINKICFSTWNW